jgi:hypothetical protein
MPLSSMITIRNTHTINCSWPLQLCSKEDIAGVVDRHEILVLINVWIAWVCNEIGDQSNSLLSSEKLNFC